MHVGDYVRTKWGEIAKIEKNAGTNSYGNLYQLDSKGEDDLYCEGNIIKSSPNIIDLIEVGDFINKQCIIEIKDKTFYTSGGYFLAFEDFDDIVETIVTHEQFSSMEYKVESEVK